MTIIATSCIIDLEIFLVGTNFVSKINENAQRPQMAKNINARPNPIAIIDQSEVVASEFKERGSKILNAAVYAIIENTTIKMNTIEYINLLNIGFSFDK